MSILKKNFIIIDGSYFIFYRYYALVQWWSFYKKEKIEKAFENEEFLNKFKTSFADKIKEIHKKLKIENPTYLVAKDCPRETIWRHAYIENYKANRVYDTMISKDISNFFQMVYKDKLFENAGVKQIIHFSELEADDCIALTTKYFLNQFKEKQQGDNLHQSQSQNKHPNQGIYIIANDIDYLQLLEPDVNINIYDLKYKSIKESKKYTGDAQQDLFCKIVMGDKSDNIPSIFPKCGLKTAIKCYKNPKFVEEKFKQFKNSKELFERNRKIIDFNYIPSEKQEQFYDDISNIFDISHI
jgi:5'-3' exonuclease